MIFGMSIVNAYLMYKENYETSRMTVLQFRDSIVRSLLLGVPYENLRPDPRERSTSQTKRKLADHKFEEKEGSTRMLADDALAAMQREGPNGQEKRATQ